MNCSIKYWGYQVPFKDSFDNLSHYSIYLRVIDLEVLYYVWVWVVVISGCKHHLEVEPLQKLPARITPLLQNIVPRIQLKSLALTETLSLPVLCSCGICLVHLYFIFLSWNLRKYAFQIFVEYCIRRSEFQIFAVWCLSWLNITSVSVFVQENPLNA